MEKPGFVHIVSFLILFDFIVQSTLGIRNKAQQTNKQNPQTTKCWKTVLLMEITSRILRFDGDEWLVSQRWREETNR